MVTEKTTTSKTKTTARRTAKSNGSSSPEVRVTTTQAAKTKTTGTVGKTTARRSTGNTTSATTTVTLEQRGHMIAEAAYYRALNRGWQQGNTVHDWLSAEAEIDAMLGQQR